LFLDDNPAERARVREALSEVKVIDLPLSPSGYKEAVEMFGCFDQTSLTKEDALRVKAYTVESQRQSSRNLFSSQADWLRSLELTAEISTVSRSNIDRVIQLINKTNQLNLSTRRLTSLELEAWLDNSSSEMRVFSISDRFGEYGLTGIISITVEGREARIVDFVLSCRVFGRQAEELMLSTVFSVAAERGAERVVATYLPTSKNKPTLEFFKERSGMKVCNESGCSNRVIFEAGLQGAQRGSMFFSIKSNKKGS